MRNEEHFLLSGIYVGPANCALDSVRTLHAADSHGCTTAPSHGRHVHLVVMAAAPTYAEAVPAAANGTRAAANGTRAAANGTRAAANGTRAAAANETRAAP